MGSSKWKRYIRVTGANGSVLRFHGIEIATIDSDDWTLDMEELLDELYNIEKDILLYEQRMKEKIVTGEPLVIEDWFPPVQLSRNNLIIIINELPIYLLPEFPAESKPADVKWHKLDTSRCTEITVDPLSANTVVKVY